MLKNTYARLLHLCPVLMTGLLTACVFSFPANVTAVNAGTNSTSPQHSEPAPGLDSKRLFALGMIETGNDDRAIGLAGEISRYQLSPSVWKSYSRSMDYRNTELAVQVARLHWNYLAAYFKEKTGHLPTDFDMYVLWNTRYGYYAHNHFSKWQISSIVKERASRFVNLVNRKEYAQK
jgi:hypothetical protein